MLIKATQITATITVSIAIGLLNSPLLAQPASIFIVGNMKRELPKGWVMRLPAEGVDLGDLHHSSANSLNDRFEVVLIRPYCQRPDGGCQAGTISTSKNNSRIIELYQKARRESYAPITLKPDLRGFYLSGQNTVIWQQDDQIYKVSGSNPSQWDGVRTWEKSTVIDIAISMANQDPIE